MTLTTLLLVSVCIVSLSIWTPLLWKFRAAIGYMGVASESAVLFYVISRHFSIWSLVLIIFAAYKVLNYARVLRSRMQVRQLYYITRKTALLVSVPQVILIILAIQQAPWPAAAAYILLIFQLLISIVFVASTQRSLRTTKTLQATKAYTDAALPSISVLIPARNETDDLQASLQSLIASNYPKLEIIVLDDCSQNKHTPEIIRSFAHDGVRFIAGDEPADNWLAKNFAYQQLADAASGDYLVFCGADLQLSPNALRELITTLLEKNKTMLSVLPHNAKPGNWLTYMVQPVRYAWEISLPRRLFNRPAVLSTCWVIKSEVLTSAGGFKAVSRTITPESYFARFTARHDGYSFLRSNLLVSDKTAAHQRETTIRVRYPQLHRRPELVLLVSLVELLGVSASLPTAVVVAAKLGVLPSLVGILSFILSYVLYLQVTGVMYGRSVIVGLVIPPLAAAYDAYLLHVSMFRYEFGEVRWKERNICLPVMRFDEATPSVPLPNRE